MAKQRREQEEESRRRLRWGIWLSLMAHFLLAFGGGWMLPKAHDEAGVANAEPPLRAQLTRSVAAPQTSAPHSLPSRSMPQDRPLARPVVPAERLAHAVAAVPPAPTFAVPATADVPAEALATSSGRAATADAPGVMSAPASSVAAGDGPDANALRGYRLALAVQARRFKRYPAQAQAQAWAGTAEVRLALAAGGHPEPATLTKSSGHEVLDRAALEMMNAAVQRTPVPATLQAQAFSISLPIVFNLDE